MEINNIHLCKYNYIYYYILRNNLLKEKWGLHHNHPCFFSSATSGVVPSTSWQMRRCSFRCSGFLKLHKATGLKWVVFLGCLFTRWFRGSLKRYRVDEVGDSEFQTMSVCIVYVISYEPLKQVIQPMVGLPKPSTFVIKKMCQPPQRYASQLP